MPMPAPWLAAMMVEAQAVAERLGVTLPDHRSTSASPAPSAVGAHKTSMLQDLERGRPLEIDALVGAVVELAQVAGVATPTIEAIYRAVKLLARTPIGERAAVVG